jgi:ubiquinone biosynthesis UbiH/UbiF/VisC/COQ6 family hydroxylase
VKKSDVIIIGAGPAGLCLARILADTGMNIVIVEKQKKSALASPQYDGREIALTHFSYNALKELGIWGLTPTKEISLIHDAKVFNGDSDYALHFSHTESGKKNLGFMVSNQVIRKAAYCSLSGRKNVRFITETEVVSIDAAERQSHVTLSNGKTISASLVVAADSRFSAARRMMGIRTNTLDFGRTCVVCTMKISKSHDKTAFEFFHYGRTLAVLPLQDQRVSVVITLATQECPDLLKMSPQLFSRDIESRAEGKFGTMRLTSALFPYPLVATFASHFYAQRFALVGDAAVGMHPVTAHGFNLGLRGTVTLAEEIKQSLSLGHDIGSPESLKRYSDKHRRASRPLYLGTNALVKLYTAETVPARFVRAAMLRLGNHLQPAKRIIINHLTGAGGVWQSSSA